MRRKAAASFNSKVARAAIRRAERAAPADNWMGVPAGQKPPEQHCASTQGAMCLSVDIWSNLWSAASARLDDALGTFNNSNA